MKNITFTPYEIRFYRQLRKEGYKGYVVGDKMLMVKVWEENVKEVVKRNREAVDSIIKLDDTVNPIIIEEVYLRGNERVLSVDAR